MPRVLLVSAAMALLALAAAWAALVPTTIVDVFLPGSQPLQSGGLQTPFGCSNCHGGYDVNVEPTFNWRGSMMSQAQRDPLYEACLAITNQDAPEAGDLCIRCHSPNGWLGGRSSPTDGSALVGIDYEGVHCDFCHRFVKPSPLGVNPFPDDPDYTAGTYAADQLYLARLDPIPPNSSNAMFIVDWDNTKRGPYNDATARHATFYSPFHSESHLCGTCHDVSNPVYWREPGDNYVPNEFNAPAPSFDQYTMFPVERTYSEWLMSEYNTPTGVFAPQFGGNKDYVSTCQDCHMRDVTGRGAKDRRTPVRTDLPLHDLTGGNAFIPALVASLYPDDIDLAALDAGHQRAIDMLQLAATVNVTVTSITNGYLASVEVINETGHKLPSGYPEGRRMWINVQANDNKGVLVFESAAYDPATGVLDKYDPTAKIYEIKPGISNQLAEIIALEAGPSFHFVINDTLYKDNRIPPRGFTNANFDQIQSPVVNYAYADGQHWDVTEYVLPKAAKEVVTTLYYQTTSKEYVEFLRDENVTNDWGNILYDLWVINGKSAPVAMNTVVTKITGPATASVDDQPHTGLPDEFMLGQNYPNPFNPSTDISFTLPNACYVTLEVFNIKGQRVATLVDRHMEAGHHTVSFDANNVASGVYPYRLQAGDFVESKKMTVVK
ncbi:MAG: T9SS type A sorting domain-containing protein [Candidatus Zixiibacteriota bacterium]|nr:MAG: T9SS type A sorting domain-containing protein [candidate division Zixibacteria bacterium]